MAERYFKEAQTAAKKQKIWKADLYGPMLLVDAQSGITYANMPDSAAVLKPTGKIYKGLLPKDVMVANTAITWSGRLWSVILWPLPKDREDRLNLIMHESFHRVQDNLGFPAHNPTAAHLSRMEGRIYFLLELQALKAALSKPINRRNADLLSALLFRAQREKLFPESFHNERLLEMNEGLAEYTGVMLGRTRDSITKHLYEVIDRAAVTNSLIRSFPYFTGPVYGYLLYGKQPSWTAKLDSNISFTQLIEDKYRFWLTKKNLEEQVAQRIGRYNGYAIISSEAKKEAEYQKIKRDYLVGFTQQPVLSIRLIKMNIVFNPNNLFDLGEEGTVYPTAQIKDVWGQLDVSTNGVLMKNWNQISLQVTGATTRKGEVIEGNGWTLKLNPGWKMEQKDSLHFSLVSNE